jgi:hypothetical protein
VRLHRVFFDAGPEVFMEIAGFITGRIRRTPRIRHYVRARSETISQRQPQSRKLLSAGRRFDLRDMFNKVNDEYFDGRLDAEIGWGAGSSRRVVKRRTLGSYCRCTNRIRINPVLDSPKVPAYFVEFVVYHEMLHADIGAVTRGGRTRVHTKEFRARERLFRQYERADKWEKSGQRVR